MINWIYFWIISGSVFNHLFLFFCIGSYTLSCQFTSYTNPNNLATQCIHSFYIISDVYTLTGQFFRYTHQVTNERLKSCKYNARGACGFVCCCSRNILHPCSLHIVIVSFSGINKTILLYLNVCI